MSGGEDLGDRRAAVVRHDVGLIEPERFAEGFEDLGFGSERYVLVGAGGRVAMTEEIGGETAPLRGKALHHMTPVAAVQEDAVDEQRRRPFPLRRIGDLADPSGHTQFLLCHVRSLSAIRAADN